MTATFLRLYSYLRHALTRFGRRGVVARCHPAKTLDPFENACIFIHGMHHVRIFRSLAKVRLQNEQHHSCISSRLIHDDHILMNDEHYINLVGNPDKGTRMHRDERVHLSTTPQFPGLLAHSRNAGSLVAHQ